MLGELLVTGIDFRIIAAGLGDTTFQIVRHHNSGGSTKVLEGPDMAAQPVGQ